MRRVELGAGAGIVLLALTACATVPRVAHPLGSDWAQYFTVAEILWFDDPHLYPPFRKPFFGMLLGLIGAQTGYLTAAQWLGRLSAAMIVAASGLGAWALVGPLCGVLAAGTALAMPLVMDGALWVNNYPSLGAACSMAIAGGAAVTRWRRPRWALLTGIGAGLALALDVRGLVVLPVAVLAVALSLRDQSGRTRLKLLAALVLPALALHAYDAWLTDTHRVPQFSLEAQTQRQRQTVLEPIARGQYVETPALLAACGPATSAPSQTPVGAALEVRPESCAQTLRAYSAAELVPRRVLPGPLTLLLLPLVLLPLRGRDRRPIWSSSLASAVVIGTPACALWASMGWVFTPERYLLPLAAVLAMLVPVALGRLGRQLAHPWSGGASLLAAVAWTAIAWPGHDARSLEAPEAIEGADMAAGAAARWADHTLDPDDRLIDCGGLALDLLLLPRQLRYTRHPPGDPACDALIRDPGAGPSWLITPVLPGQRGLALDPIALAQLGWAQAETPPRMSRYRVWRWEGP